MRKDIKRIKEKVEELEKGNKKKWRILSRERSIEGRLKKVERNMERRENEKRRKNIIIRRVEIRKGKRRKAEEILKILGAKAEIKEIRKIGEMIEKDGKMMLIKLGNEELIGKRSPHDEGKRKNNRGFDMEGKKNKMEVTGNSTE